MGFIQMDKLMKIFKSDGAFVIYTWISVLIVGILTWNLTFRITNTEEENRKFGSTIVRLLDVFQPSPIFLWIVFLIVVLIATFVTVTWIKNKKE